MREKNSQGIKIKKLLKCKEEEVKSGSILQLEKHTIPVVAGTLELFKKKAGELVNWISGRSNKCKVQMIALKVIIICV